MSTDLNPVPIQIYVPRIDKAAFSRACFLCDTTMSRELRRFIRQYCDDPPLNNFSLNVLRDFIMSDSSFDSLNSTISKLDIENISKDLANIYDCIVSLSSVSEIETLDTTNFSSFIDLLADKANGTFSKVEFLLNDLSKSCSY